MKYAKPRPPLQKKKSSESSVTPRCRILPQERDRLEANRYTAVKICAMAKSMGNRYANRRDAPIRYRLEEMLSDRKG